MKDPRKALGRKDKREMMGEFTRKRRREEGIVGHNYVLEPTLNYDIEIFQCGSNYYIHIKLFKSILMFCGTYGIPHNISKYSPHSN